VASDPVHATCVAIRGAGVLIEGPSGAGKSDLALRLIDRGATLVSDDYTLLAPSPAGPLASPPATIAGRMEVRGIGIVSVPHTTGVPVRLVVRLSSEIERMPEPDTCDIAGARVPATTVDPAAPSAPIKVELALRALEGEAA
jgi:serine kinase of HPr protein (carbohydrate metabolism regulator)